MHRPTSESRNVITVIIPTGTRLIIADTEQVIETVDALRITLDIAISKPLREVPHFRIGDDIADSDCEQCAGSGVVKLSEGYGLTDCPCTFPQSQVTP